MNSISTNQEILLLSNSTFLKRDWAERNTTESNKKLSQNEQLIQHCWNGMLKELIPEIMETGRSKKQLSLWEVNELDHLIDLRYGDYDEFINNELSVNPYVFSRFCCLN